MHIEKSINETKSRLLQKEKSQSFEVADLGSQGESEVPLEESQEAFPDQVFQPIREEDHEGETTQNVDTIQRDMSPEREEEEEEEEREGEFGEDTYIQIKPNNTKLQTNRFYDDGPLMFQPQIDPKSRMMAEAKLQGTAYARLHDQAKSLQNQEKLD